MFRPETGSKTLEVQRPALKAAPASSPHFSSEVSGFKVRKNEQVDFLIAFITYFYPSSALLHVTFEAAPAAHKEKFTSDGEKVPKLLPPYFSTTCCGSYFLF